MQGGQVVATGWSMGLSPFPRTFLIVVEDGIPNKAPTQYNATLYTMRLRIGEDIGDAAPLDRGSEDGEEHREDGRYSEGARGKVEAPRQDPQDPRDRQRAAGGWGHGNYSSQGLRGRGYGRE